LAEDHDVLFSGLIMSRVGMYRIAWGVVSHPGGSRTARSGSGPRPYGTGRERHRRTRTGGAPLSGVPPVGRF
ncbi:hypothetical protein ACWEK7_12070, partial [Streptomyces californicus]